MRHILAILIAFFLVLGAASASAQSSPDCGESHFQLWPDSPLAVAAFLGPWTAWVLVMLIKGVAGSGSSTRKAGGTKPSATPPKKKEDEEE